MNRTIVLLTLGAAAAGCGGGSEDTETSGPSAAGTQAPEAPATTGDTEQTPTTTGSGEPSAPSGDPGTGTATVGDQTWEFAVPEGDGRSFCMLTPQVVVSMFGTDQNGNEVNLTINGPETGGEGAVTAGDPTIQGDRWVADVGVYDQLSGIEGMPDGIGATIQVDGTTVSGSGRFYEDRRLNEVRPTGGPYDAGARDGTFTATCPPSQ